MTLERLEQYAALRREVADLEKRVERLQERTQRRVADTVKASMTAYPYTEHTVTVKGYSERSARHLRRVSTLLARRRADLAEDLEGLEAWINAIPDSRTRQLIQHHYIDGRSWAASAQRVYGHPCESTARSRVERYMKNNL